MLLGKRLVKSLLLSKDLKILTKHNVHAGDLLKDAREAFDWVLTYFNEKGEWPTERMLTESTGISLPEEADDLSYIADQVRKRALAKKLENRAYFRGKNEISVSFLPFFPWGYRPFNYRMWGSLQVFKQ